MKLVSAIASAGLGASASLGAVAALAQSPISAQVSPGGLEEIIVTAQRREETVQKSSLSIQVLSDDELWQAGVARRAT